jgi:ribosomal protein S1
MSGKVVSLTDYGAFVELEAGIEGLIHVSEMSWSKRVKHPSKILNVGDSVDAMVLGVDPRRGASRSGSSRSRATLARADREVPGRDAHQG